MIQLVIHEDARSLGIVHPVACVIKNVTVSSKLANLLEDEAAKLLQKLAEEPETILERPEVQGFRELFAKMGYPEQTPAGQRLVESFQRRGFKSYNNVVDAYNISSALFGSGLGMHDFALLDGDVHVYRATGDEQIVPLFKKEAVKVQKDDLVYSCDQNLLAWLGKRDIDSNDFRVKEDTHSLLLIALGNAVTSEEYNRKACLKAVELIRRTCPEAVVDFTGVS